MNKDALINQPGLKDKLKNLIENDKVPVSQIAEELDTSTVNLYSIIHKFGIKLNNARRKNAPKKNGVVKPTQMAFTKPKSSVKKNMTIDNNNENMYQAGFEAGRKYEQLLTGK